MEAAVAAGPAVNARGLFQELQQHWAERAEAQSQLKLLPLQKKARENDLAKKTAALAAEREAIKRLKVEADKAELGLKSNDQRIKDLTGKLNQCRVTKEYETLQHEIETVKTNSSQLEEQILEMISDQETKSAGLIGHEKALQATKDDFGKFVELIEYKVQKMVDRVKILDGRIGEIEKLIKESDPDLANMYRRITANKGAQGIAPCENGYCQNCNIEQTPQVSNELNSDHIVQCSSCGALLYRA